MPVTVDLAIALISARCCGRILRFPVYGAGVIIEGSTVGVAIGDIAPISARYEVNPPLDLHIPAASAIYIKIVIPNQGIVSHPHLAGQRSVYTF